MGGDGGWEEMVGRGEIVERESFNNVSQAIR